MALDMNAVAIPVGFQGFSGNLGVGAVWGFCANFGIIIRGVP